MKFCVSQIAALTTVAALAVSGCGGSEEPEGEKLPSDVTQALLERLDSISDRVAAGVSGACDDIYDESVGDIGPIDDALASVPNDVAPEIRSALEQSIDRLKQLVDDECAEISAREQQESTPKEEPAPIETKPDETTTEETDTETSPETTPDTDTDQSEQPQNPGRGPDGTGPPGQGDGGGFEVPSDGDDE